MYEQNSIFLKQAVLGRDSDDLVYDSLNANNQQMYMMNQTYTKPRTDSNNYSQGYEHNGATTTNTGTTTSEASSQKG